MTKFFVANCTSQVQDFQYRLIENHKLMKQTIPIGQQIQIPGDLSAPDVTSIIEQHAPYGMVRVDEIDRTKDFIGVCYSLDKRVDVEKVRRAALHNFKVLDALGHEIRREAAVAINNSLEEQTQSLKALEVAIVEEERKGHDTQVNEKMRVTRTDNNGNAPKAGRGRKAV